MKITDFLNDFLKNKIIEENKENKKIEQSIQIFNKINEESNNDKNKKYNIIKTKYNYFYT